MLMILKYKHNDLSNWKACGRGSGAHWVGKDWVGKLEFEDGSKLT